MSKKYIVGGNRKHFVQRPGTSHTSPARVKLWRRRAQALELREQSLTYREIAKRLGCKSATIAHQLVVGALAEMIPIEQRDAVRQMELTRLEKLMQTYYPAAQKKDIAAAKVYLKIAAEHSKLAGLYPQSGQPLVVNNTVAPTGAQRFGINLNFVGGQWVERPDGTTVWVNAPEPAKAALPPPPPPIEAAPEPHREPASVGPNILDFRKC